MEYLSNALALTMREGVPLRSKCGCKMVDIFPLMGEREREGQNPVRFDSEEFVLGAANWHREG